MSGNPKDDEHDDAVDSAWKREFREEPSATTDVVIRAAAQRELASRRAQRARHGWLGQWTPFAAAAAVGVLAFGLVRWLPVDHELTTVPPSPSIESDENAPESSRRGAYDGVATTPALTENGAERAAPSEPQAQPPQTPGAAAERHERMTGPSPSDAADRATVQSGRSPSPSPPADVLPQAPRSQEASKHATPEAASVDAGAEVEVTSNNAQFGAAAPTSKTAARPDEEVSAAARQTVRRITELHTAGRLGEAAETLRELRSIEPRADDLLPPELRQWAATVAD